MRCSTLLRAALLARRPPVAVSLTAARRLVRPYTTSSCFRQTALLRFQHGTGQQSGGSAAGDVDEADDFFDAGASLAKDALRVTRGTQIESLLADWLPRYADDSIRDAARSYFQKTPINAMITCEQVLVTHMDNEAGEEVKHKVPQMSRDDAIALAADNGEGMVLVQMAERGGVAYCRIRDEKRRFLATVQESLDRLAAAAGIASGGGDGAGASTAGAGGAPMKKRTLRDTNLHAFSDVVDAYFINWRSDKILKELARAHPIKLTIQRFQSPETAIAKMQEMLEAIRTKCTAADNAAYLVHHCSGIGLSANELSVTLMPVVEENSKVKQIRHPSQQDWNNAEQRLYAATGGRGTYAKSTGLKKQYVSAREFRVDRFGRRIDDSKGRV